MINFIQETFNFFVEAKKAIQKTKQPSIYLFAKNFIKQLNQRLLLTKQSKNPQISVKKYLVIYKNKIDKQNESIRNAIKENKNPKTIKNMRWKLQLYRKAYNDFNLLKNLQSRKK